MTQRKAAIVSKQNKKKRKKEKGGEEGGRPSAKVSEFRADVSSHLVSHYEPGDKSPGPVADNYLRAN